MLNFNVTIDRLKANGMLESQEKIQSVIDTLIEQADTIGKFVEMAMSDECQLTMHLSATSAEKDYSFAVLLHHKEGPIGFALECGREYMQLIEHLKTLAQASPSGCEQTPHPVAP